MNAVDSEQPVQRALRPPSMADFSAAFAAMDTEQLGSVRQALVIDDDPFFRGALLRDLRNLGWQAAGARTFLEAVSQIDARPSWTVIFLDMNLPDGDGIDLLPVVRSYSPSATVIAISGSLTAARCLALYERGVRLCLPKPVKPHDLTRVLALLEHRAAHEPALWRLSEREREILNAARRGLSRKEVAQALSISVSSVTTYWQRIYKKSGLRSERSVLAALDAAARDRAPR